MKRPWKLAALLLFVLIPALVTLGARHLAGVVTLSPPALDCAAEFNLGERERLETLTYPFTLGNSGGQDLILDQFGSSCSCAGVEEDVGGTLAKVTSLALRK